MGDASWQRDMVKKDFKQGDIVIMDFMPIRGHEQNGRRPAIILRNASAAKVTNMVAVCPITNTHNRHILHVPLDDRTKTTGVILCEHVRSVDLAERNAMYAEQAPQDIVELCIEKVYSMIE